MNLSPSTQPDRPSLSESEEMYLITIADIMESDALETVPLSHLAEHLNIHAVSANQMIRKLEEQELVIYTPYKGVSLTAEGERTALRIMRSRRLWEVCLVQHLNIPDDEAAALACGMEHLTDNRVCDSLDRYLNCPQFNPQGKLIPQGCGSVITDHWFSLNECRADDRLLVRQIKGDAATRAYLAAQGVFPGAEVSVLAASDAGGFLLESSGSRIQINNEIAAQIITRRCNPISRNQEKPL